MGVLMIILKSDLERDARELIEKIKEFEDRYKIANSIGMSTSDIDIKLLRGYKSNLEGRLRMIAKFPESQPSQQEIDKLHDEGSENYEKQANIRIAFRQMDRHIKELQRECEKIMKPLENLDTSLPIEEQNLLKNQKIFNDLISKIEEDILEKSEYEIFDFHGEEDSELQSRLNRLNMHRGSFSNFSDIRRRDIEKSKTPKDKAAAYEKAIVLLKEFQEHGKRFKDEVKERHAVLESISSGYQDNVKHKNLFVKQARELLLKIKEFESDKEVATFYKEINTQLGAIDKRQYFESNKGIVGSFISKITEDKKSLIDRLRLANKESKEDVQSLGKMVMELEKKLKHLEARRVELEQQRVKEKEKIEQLIEAQKAKIMEQQEIFDAKYADIIGKLETHSLPTDAITKIKNKFNEENLKAPETTEPTERLKFFEDKLNNLRKISQELELAVIKQEAVIVEISKKTIDVLVSDINAKRKEIIQKIGEGNKQVKPALKEFKFSISEMELLNQIKNFKLTTVDYSKIGSSDQLSAELKSAINKKETFEKDLAKLKKVVNTHEQAQTFVDMENFNLIVGSVNSYPETEDAVALLTATTQYSSNLLKLINDNDNLAQFNEAGLNAINEFIKPYVSKDAQEINKKLKFIELVSSKGVVFEDCFGYLNKPEVMKAVELLQKNKLDKFITQEALNNDSFCKVLDILDKHHVTLTTDLMGKLSTDKNKCDIINHIGSNNKAKRDEGISTELSTGPLSDDAFKKMLSDFMTMDEKTAHAINVIREKQPALCEPWFLVFAHHHSTLKELLSDENNLEHNIPFVVALFNDNKVRYQLHSKGYLAAKPEHEKVEIGLIQQLFDGEITKNLTLNQALTLLSDVNKNPERFDFKNMAKIMATINDLACSPLFESTKNRMPHFQSATIPILLSDKSLGEKQSLLHSAAREHFPHPDRHVRFLNAIIDAINYVIERINLISSKKFGFFPSVQTEEHAAIKEVVLKDEAGATKAGSEIDAAVEGNAVNPDDGDDAIITYK